MPRSQYWQTGYADTHTTGPSPEGVPHLNWQVIKAEVCNLTKKDLKEIMTIFLNSAIGHKTDTPNLKLTPLVEPALLCWADWDA